jgi:hypothetical protein
VFVHVDELIVRVESRAACVRFPTWKYPVPYCAFIRERILLSLSSEQHEPEPHMNVAQALALAAEHNVEVTTGNSAAFDVGAFRVYAVANTRLWSVWIGEVEKRGTRANVIRMCVDATLAQRNAPSVKWAALVAKAEALGTSSKAFYATMDAECNAADTLVEQGRADAVNDPLCADEKAEIAYGSLCWTPNFQEDAAVRAFFEAAGYRW